MRSGEACMGDIVNLRRFRKQKARAAKDQQASQNRAAYGRPKHERQRAEVERHLQARRIDLAKREEPGAGD